VSREPPRQPLACCVGAAAAFHRPFFPSCRPQKRGRTRRPTSAPLTGDDAAHAATLHDEAQLEAVAAPPRAAALVEPRAQQLQDGVVGRRRGRRRGAGGGKDVELLRLRRRARRRGRRRARQRRGRRARRCRGVGRRGRRGGAPAAAAGGGGGRRRGADPLGGGARRRAARGLRVTRAGRGGVSGAHLIRVASGARPAAPLERCQGRGAAAAARAQIAPRRHCSGPRRP
jgi:hypothetical protein